MKQVTRVVIQTIHARYQMTLPNVTVPEAEELIEEAKDVAIAKMKELGGKEPFVFAIFDFNNEHLEIFETPLFIHAYLREQVYEFDTPDIRITAR